MTTNSKEVDPPVTRQGAVRVSRDAEKVRVKEQPGEVKIKDNESSTPLKRSAVPHQPSLRPSTATELGPDGGGTDFFEFPSAEPVEEETGRAEDVKQFPAWTSCATTTTAGDEGFGTTAQLGTDLSKFTWEAVAQMTDLNLVAATGNIPEGRVVGVYFDKQRRIWRANWREGNVGKRKTKNFSVDDFGFEEARRLAIQYRFLKIMEASEKQMGRDVGCEKSRLFTQELKRKAAEGKSGGGDSSSKGKKRRRYTLNSHCLLKKDPWSGAFIDGPSIESLGYPPEAMHVLSAAGCEEQFYMNALPPWNPWESVGAVGVDDPWNVCYDDESSCETFDGVSIESPFVVMSYPPESEVECGKTGAAAACAGGSTIVQANDVVTTADTGSDEDEEGRQQQFWLAGVQRLEEAPQA